MKNLNLIVAKSKDNIIGINNQLPWRLKNDLVRFKSITTNNIVIMGRKTFESIGKPLPNRENIIVSDNRLFQVYGTKTLTLNNTKAYIKNNPTKIFFVIGGGQIYNEFLPLVNKIYLTEVDVYLKNGIKFPELDMNDWNVIKQLNYLKDESNEYNYSFIDLERTFNGKFYFKTTI